MEDARTEALLLEPLVTNHIVPDVYRELIEILPNLVRDASKPARVIPSGRDIRPLIIWHRKNSQPVFQ